MNSQELSQSLYSFLLQLKTISLIQQFQELRHLYLFSIQSQQISKILILFHNKILYKTTALVSKFLKNLHPLNKVLDLNVNFH